MLHTSKTKQRRIGKKQFSVTLKYDNFLHRALEAVFARFYIDGQIRAGNTKIVQDVAAAQLQQKLQKENAAAYGGLDAADQMKHGSFHFNIAEVFPIPPGAEVQTYFIREMLKCMRHLHVSDERISKVRNIGLAPYDTMQLGEWIDFYDHYVKEEINALRELFEAYACSL